MMLFDYPETNGQDPYMGFEGMPSEEKWFHDEHCYHCNDGLPYMECPYLLGLEDPPEENY